MRRGTVPLKTRKTEKSTFNVLGRMRLRELAVGGHRGGVLVKSEMAFATRIDYEAALLKKTRAKNRFISPRAIIETGLNHLDFRF